MQSGRAQQAGRHTDTGPPDTGGGGGGGGGAVGGGGDGGGGAVIAGLLVNAFCWLRRSPRSPGSPGSPGSDTLFYCIIKIWSDLCHVVRRDSRSYFRTIDSSDHRSARQHSQHSRRLCSQKSLQLGSQVITKFRI